MVKIDYMQSCIAGRIIATVLFQLAIWVTAVSYFGTKQSI